MLLYVLCPSVRLSVLMSVFPSVCDVQVRDHIDWNTSKIISRLISIRFTLAGDTNMGHLVQQEHGLHLIMYRTIRLLGYNIGRLTLAPSSVIVQYPLVRQSDALLSVTAGTPRQ